MMFCILFLPSLAQSVNHIVDSTKMVSVPKWKAERLLQAYFFTLPLCDSTVIKMSLAIDTLNLALERSKELTSVITLQRDNKAAEAETLRKQAINTKAIHDQEIKQIKRQSLKFKVIAAGEFAILLIIIIL